MPSEVQIEAVRIVVRADSDADTSYLEQPEFADRLAQYHEGDFCFVGVQVEAELSIPVDEGHTRVIQRIDTPGLWSIESDSGENYFRETASDEWETLRDMLGELGVDLPNGDGLDYTDAPIVYR